MDLKQATMELHHAAERHAVGARLADGTIPAQWYADWLYALLAIHMVVDLELPESMHRTDALMDDLLELEAQGVEPNPNESAMAYAAGLKTPEQRLGAAYVFTGAHLMGGEITKKHIDDRLPVNHLTWINRKQTVQEWKPLRERIDLESHARNAFETVLAVMDEIVSHDAAAA